MSGGDLSLLLPVDIPRPRNLKVGILSSALLFKLPHQRQDIPPEQFNLLVVVQKGRQHEVDAEALEQHQPLGDLLPGPDEPGLEAVVVLDQVVEPAVGPHALLVGRAGAGLADRVAERVDGVGVGLALDLPQHADGLLLGLADDDEAVDGEADVALAADLGGARPDVLDLGAEAVEVVAVHEVPVADLGAVVARVVAVAALEDLRVRLLDGLGVEDVVSVAVEVAAEREAAAVVGRRPDALEAADELVAAAVALGVLEPPLADGRELALEPAADDVDGDAAVAVVVDAGDLLGDRRRVPRPREDGGDDLDGVGGLEDRLGEGHGLVLVGGAVPGREPDLRQAVLDAGLLRRLGVLDVAREVPYNNALGLFMIIWCVFVLAYLVASLPTNVAYILIFVFVELAFVAVAASYFAAADGKEAASTGLKKAGGAFAFVAGLVGWYLTFHLLLKDSVVELPLGDTSQYFPKTRKRQE
ncbi:hypothetical protein CTA1_5231 [Colletotrichum tanaceti]|uniref:Uncharacterized protein n=1 Tax=Colletotrichum tanaceti TaxID=1306861 RepID=A0A4U6XR63_9PEZI|nr:hypothetical protein CTA1_5231 [Colletotrichum tanaceti]